MSKLFGPVSGPQTWEDVYPEPEPVRPVRKSEPVAEPLYKSAPLRFTLHPAEIDGATDEQEVYRAIGTMGGRVQDVRSEDGRTVGKLREVFQSHFADGPVPVGTLMVGIQWTPDAWPEGKAGKLSKLTTARGHGLRLGRKVSAR
jgi:hypothetical protein